MLFFHIHFSQNLSEGKNGKNSGRENPDKTLEKRWKPEEISFYEGDRPGVDLDKGLLRTLIRKLDLTAQPLPRFVQSILEAGAIENYLKTHDGFDV